MKAQDGVIKDFKGKANETDIMKKVYHSVFSANPLLGSCASRVQQKQLNHYCAKQDLLFNLILLTF